MSLAAGETKDVPVSWYDYTAGERSLTCKPLIPAAFNDITDLVADQSGATTETITWEYVAEAEDSLIPLIILGASVVVGMAVLVAVDVKKRMEAEASVDQQTVEEEEKVYPEND